MGKGHKDNYRARKKRGNQTFELKASRRSYKVQTQRRGCAWIVEFLCGAHEIVPTANSSDIGEVVTRQHSCSKGDCKPIKFNPIKA